MTKLRTIQTYGTATIVFCLKQTALRAFNGLIPLMLLQGGQEASRGLPSAFRQQDRASQGATFVDWLVNSSMSLKSGLSVHDHEDSMARDAARIVLDKLKLAESDRPSIGIILGSGLGPAADRLLSTGGSALSYRDIPNMPQPHVSGHAGRLVVGRIHGVSVAMLQGRVHYYEGHAPSAIVFGARLLEHLGISKLIVTNAAGGIRRGFTPGDLMIISSHVRPLAAANLDISAMLDVESPDARVSRQRCLWSASLRDAALQVPTPLKVHTGVYAMMTGPTYETPAEIRMLQGIGADAVGMSTVPEATFAASRAIHVLGVSCITNVAAGLSDKTLNHSEVTETATSIEAEFVKWLWDTISRLPTCRD